MRWRHIKHCNTYPVLLPQCCFKQLTNQTKPKKYNYEFAVQPLQHYDCISYYLLDMSGRETLSSREYFYSLLDIVQQKSFCSAGHCPAENIFILCLTSSSRKYYFGGHCPAENFFLILLDIIQQRIFFLILLDIVRQRIFL